MTWKRLLADSTCSAPSYLEHSHFHQSSPESFFSWRTGSRNPDSAWCETNHQSQHIQSEESYRRIGLGQLLRSAVQRKGEVGTIFPTRVQGFLHFHIFSSSTKSSLLSASDLNFIPFQISSPGNTFEWFLKRF